jgi:DNA-binding CsgD family transcriptional regulator
MLDHLKLVLSIIIEIFAVILLVKLINKKYKLSALVSKVYILKLCIIFAINTLYIFVKYYELNIDLRYNGISFENKNHIVFFSFFLLILFNSLLSFKLLKYFFKGIRPIVSKKWSLIISLLLIICFGIILISKNTELIKMSFNFQITTVFLLVFLEPINSLIILIFKKRINSTIVKTKLFFEIHLWKTITYLIFIMFIVVSSYSILIEFFELVSYPLLILIYFISAFFLGNYFQKSEYNSIEDKWKELKLRYSLTSREKEISELITLGKSNKEIEQLLFISHSTVKNHLSNIYRKFNVNSRLELSTLINNDFN